MKKSEAVLAMTNKYLELNRGGWSEATEKERMEEILNLLEEFGMLPPEYDRNEKTKWCGIYYYYANEWEPE